MFPVKATCAWDPSYNRTGPEPAKINVVYLKLVLEINATHNILFTSDNSLNCIFQILAVVPKCTTHLRGLPTANLPICGKG